MYIAVHIMFDVAPSLVDFTPNYLLLGFYMLYIISLVHTLSSGLLLCKLGICTKEILKVWGHFCRITAMGLVWRYGDTPGKSTWKGLSWGMVFSIH
jgi:hypothetical protein